MAIPRVLILDDAGIKIGDGATPTEALTELACVANHVELSPDVSTTELATMCGSVDYPGVVKWSLIATLYQSFDPGATEETLSEAVESGVAVGFEVIGYKSQPVSATNPKWTGKVIPQPYAPISGDAGEASTIELEWAVVGDPVKSTTVSAAAAEGTGYDAMTLAELQALATERGLSTSGTKADIAARLTEADTAA